jgi:hypothetical protein
VAKEDVRLFLERLALQHPRDESGAPGKRARSGQ